ncbi:hypothetical protein SDRG_13621 [Saprolegnia diclina VS20]|uniref:Uncharacterized protein n=1 Tax=Saprolegnia diclina (strain VS20) TaxID=1156394 RepID=T0R8W6_SAPDV|nr:hypothetical protein SDRG_13621 [Saprolegnia diclina VS20]EQC28543.1 hypothetical protein SDRG_13621 [Saprolegnia diclina VS20]|eukprot:XP_008617940.1 hypothetical protein SDRG_13621 [Saprolegnia diclina VS20]
MKYRYYRTTVLTLLLLLPTATPVATPGCIACAATGNCTLAYQNRSGIACDPLASGEACCCPRSQICASTRDHCHCRRKEPKQPSPSAYLIEMWVGIIAAVLITACLLPRLLIKCITWHQAAQARRCRTAELQTPGVAMTNGIAVRADNDRAYASLPVATKCATQP